MFRSILFGIAAAQNELDLRHLVQNPDDNTCQGARSCWSADEVKYDPLPEICTSDVDCNEGHYCLCYRWEFNLQTDGACGCFRDNVCAGNGSYDVFEEDRKHQFFCTEEQHEAQKDAELPYANMEPVEDKILYGEWEPACKVDSDCPHPEPPYN